MAFRKSRIRIYIRSSLPLSGTNPFRNPPASNIISEKKSPKKSGKSSRPACPTASQEYAERESFKFQVLHEFEIHYRVNPY
jgi:hypothetical protein